MIKNMARKNQKNVSDEKCTSNKRVKQDLEGVIVQEKILRFYISVNDLVSMHYRTKERALVMDLYCSSEVMYSQYSKPRIRSTK